MKAVSKILSKRSRFVLIVFAILFAFIWLFPPKYLYFLKGLSSYLPLHMLMETFSIIVAAMIFSVGWEAYGKEKSGNIIIIATAFLAVVFIDFAHMLSFAGMPVFVTPSDPEKAIFFWLCGRFFVAVAMLYIVINAWKPLRSSVSRYLILAVSLMSTALIYWIGLWHQDILPHTFIPGHGLTPLKIYLEWSVVAILAVAAIFLIKKMLEKKQSYDTQNVLMAIYLMILSEIFFMLYADVADLYNFMGHVYKVAAYYYLYRAIFVENIQKPYKELEEVNTAVSDLYNNAPCGYHSLDRDSMIVMINDMELSWLGYTREEIIGKMKFTDILAPKSVEIFKENFPKFKERGWVQDLEFELIRKDGTTFPILVSATTINDSAGNYLMSRSTVYDISELKKAENTLLEKEERLTLATIHNGIGVWDWNLQTQKMIWDDSMFALYHIRREDFSGTEEAWRASLHPDDLERGDREVQDAIAGRKPFDTEFRVIWPNGEIHYIKAVAKVFFDEDGTPLRMLGTNIDITERKKNEQELQEKERHSQSLLRLSKNLELAQTYGQVIDTAREEVKTVLGYQNIWVYLFSEDKKYAYSLAAGGSMSDIVMSEEGTAKLTIIGDPMLEEIASAKDIVLVEDAQTDPRTDKKLVSQMGIHTIVNIPIIFFDRHMGSVGTGTFGDEGIRVPSKTEEEYLRALASHLAITLDRIHLLIERKKAEEALTLAGLYNRSLIEASLDPLVTINPDGKITDVNAATEAVTGLSRRELVGTDFSGYFSEPEKASAGYHQVFETGFVKDYPLEIKHKNGNLTPVVYNASVYKDKNGKITGVFAAARDVSEQKKAEQEIRKLNRIYRMLSDCNQSLIRADDENTLIANICRIITEEGGYRMAWVGYAQNDNEKTVKPVAYAGYEEGYLSQRKFSWGDNEYGRGPTGTAIRTGQYFTVSNYDTDPRFSPWREEAQKRGYASSVAFTLMTNGKPFGALSIYGGTADAFNENELMLLQELTSDLAFGITTIRTRIEREHVRTMLSEAQRLTHIGSWELDLGSNLLSWSDEIYRMFEIDPAKFGASYDAFLAAIHPDDRDAVNAAYTNSLKTKRPYAIDHRLLFPDGRIKYVHEQCETYYDKDDKPLRSVGTVQDVTELKLAEGALRENEHFLDNVIENIPNMLFVKEAKTLKFIRLNKAGQKLLGYSQEELIGKNDYDFFPKEQADFFTSKDQEIITGGKLMDIPEEPINTKNLGQRYLHTKKIPVFADDGTPLYLIGISEDITELREAREALKRLNEGLEAKVKERTAQLEVMNKELEAFTYSVSHDLRAPLRAIDGFSAAVMEDYGDKVGEGGKEYLQRVRDASQKMATLIDDLLSLSRLTRGELNRTSVNLSTIAADVVRTLREADPDRVVDVIIAENMTDEADPHFMEIVFTNLLNNAWKFTSKKDKAKIEFNFTQKDGKKVYYIKDNGAGFDMNYAGKMFQPFQRLHTAEEFPGTGIGLTTVHRIIKKHGGDIWAEGEVNKGATFYFTLGG